MRVARIAEIHRYPVKSMSGERLDEIEIRVDGLRGDRAWAIRDEARGSTEGARKLPALLGCRARFAGPVGDADALPVPEIELPGGRWLRADSPAVAEHLTKLTGRTLTLWPRLPAASVDHYRRGAPDHPDLLDELRATFARLPDEPLPDIGSFPREVLTSSTLPGTYFDCYPLFLLTRASLGSLSAATPSSRFDPRRFRPNLLLESVEPGGYPENAWVGKRLRVGQAVFNVAMECPRCVMTTHPIAELPKDPAIMRTLVKENGGNVGIYASVETSGVVREGDAVELID